MEKYQLKSLLENIYTALTEADWVEDPDLDVPPDYPQPPVTWPRDRNGYLIDWPWPHLGQPPGWVLPNDRPPGWVLPNDRPRFKPHNGQGAEGEDPDGPFQRRPVPREPEPPVLG